MALEIMWLPHDGNDHRATVKISIPCSPSVVLFAETRTISSSVYLSSAKASRTSISLRHRAAFHCASFQVYASSQSRFAQTVIIASQKLVTV